MLLAPDSDILHPGVVELPEAVAMTWKADKIPFALVNVSGDFNEGLARLGVSATDFTGGDKPQ